MKIHSNDHAAAVSRGAHPATRARTRVTPLSGTQLVVSAHVHYVPMMPPRVAPMRTTPVAFRHRILANLWAAVGSYVGMREKIELQDRYV